MSDRLHFDTLDDAARLRNMVEVMSMIMADCIEEGENVGPAIIRNWGRTYKSMIAGSPLRREEPIINTQGLIDRIAEIHATMHALANGLQLIAMTVLDEK